LSSIYSIYQNIEIDTSRATTHGGRGGRGGRRELRSSFAAKNDYSESNGFSTADRLPVSSARLRDSRQVSKETPCSRR
jgi:hypothetical protein